ncbi:glutamate-1-semialdehyde-2,1-aminomutase [Terriglobus albidus]|uniref:Glutamate-1-semialdehyde 2,1-aminomutase n=1 Tax=Terriglobus albidus TaxID=1592106 RepID=A0A5B9E549_9BACT|nr:glutamate-1-semialdehyde-2,1-aminomutase [Terriglobus albidus]
MTRVLEMSRSLQRRAEGLFPGGVNSPVRAFRSVGGDAPFLERAQGAYLYDADGNRYIDYFGSWGPMVLGHAVPEVVDAIRYAAGRSASFGASHAGEAELGELIRTAVPSMERMRFVSSGTEATMSAIRVARGFTRRRYVIKFEGCYHGHADGLLVKAGSGVATFGIPGSAGVPDEVAHFTLALPYNDIAAVEAAFAKHKGDIAAIILEPVVGNAGTLIPKAGYLEALRSLTEAEGALLIFDEVMTGFRLALGGAQQRFGIKPDLTTMGKIVGGGLPVGVFGGREDVMNMLAPLGPVYQAGTLSGNPLAMAAGSATVGRLIREAGTIYPQIDETTRQVAEGVAQVAADTGVRLTTNRLGSMWTWFFTPDAVENFEDAAKSDTAAFGRFHRAMMEEGVWLPPSQFEAAFIGLAHGKDEVEKTIAAARKAFV